MLAAILMSFQAEEVIRNRIEIGTTGGRSGDGAALPLRRCAAALFAGMKKQDQRSIPVLILFCNMLFYGTRFKPVFFIENPLMRRPCLPSG